MTPTVLLTSSQLQRNMSRVLLTISRRKRYSISFLRCLSQKSDADQSDLSCKEVKNDCIGTPDMTSNIPPIKCHIPPNETPLEKQYREQTEETQRWHHEFWFKRNELFSKLKKEFVEQKLADKRTSGSLTESNTNEGKEDQSEVLSADEMADFYKKYLQDNSQLQREYDREWRKRNLELTMLAARVKLSHFRRKLFRTKESSQNS